MQAADDALSAIVEATRKTSAEADNKFASAVEVLGRYECDYHARSLDDHLNWSVHQRMDTAKAKDKASSTLLSSLKEKLRVRRISHASMIASNDDL